MPKIEFIDLFAGLGGIRLGFEKAFQDLGFETKCVMTSEIKPYAVETLAKNFSHDYFVGDIFGVQNEQIPDFDFLLGGFPCQPFSTGGKRQGFTDTRGTLFFEIERIIKDKNPYGFILENVEGLVKHDLENKDEKIGRTLKTILYKLETELGYNVTWKVLDSIDFGLPQSRKRIFIVGTKNEKANLTNPDKNFQPLKTILENGLETIKSDFIEKLLSNFEIEDLYGKSIKDKRGGAEKIGIDWMDGMALTLKQIATFYKNENLEMMLQDLVQKGYLRFEYPKKLVYENGENGEKKYRVYDETKPKGYNIVTGKLSFEINKILDPNDIAPTLVATDVSRLAVPDNNGLRRLTIREGLRLFGYPEWYKIPVKETEAFDLLGNTVAVPVVQHVANQLAEIYKKNIVYSTVSETPVCS